MRTIIGAFNQQALARPKSTAEVRPLEVGEPVRPRPQVDGEESWEQYGEALSKYKANFELWMIAEIRTHIVQHLRTLTKAGTHHGSRADRKLANSRRPLEPEFEDGQTWCQYQEALAKHWTEHEKWVLEEAKDQILQHVETLEKASTHRGGLSGGVHRNHSKPLEPTFQDGQTWKQYLEARAKYKIDYDEWVFAKARSMMEDEFAVWQQTGGTFPPLHWLGMASPDAEVINSRGLLSKFLFGNTTYAEMKEHWAVSDPPNEYDIGAPSHEELLMLTPENLIAPFIRPATADEIERYRAILRDRERLTTVTRLLGHWGFEQNGGPLPEFANDGNLTQRALNAWEDIKREFIEQGLLAGSLFEYEAEMRKLFPNTPGTFAAHVGIAKSDGHQDAPVETSPPRGLSKIAGMNDLKEQLRHEVIEPFLDPELFQRYRVSLPNGILFFGPPGCGKTYIARSLSEELGWFFQYCRPSDVASPYIHATVSRIRSLFALAVEKAPSIVFIDEFEAFVPARSELGAHQQYKAEEVNEFLANLEGCAERGVLVIAATNEPERIDQAVRRSGRFDKLIFVPPPDADARRAMLEFHLSDRPAEASLDTAGIAAILEGYSASDIKLLVDEAARMALKRKGLITSETMLTVLERVPASITAEEVRRYFAFRSRG